MASLDKDGTPITRQKSNVGFPFRADSIPSGISDELLNTILGHLGIEASTDEYGERQLKLQFDDGITWRPAFFNHRTKVWDIAPVSLLSDPRANVSSSRMRSPPPAPSAQGHHKIRAVPNGASRKRSYETWLDHLPRTHHVEFFKETSWAATPLGPLEMWPESLRLYTDNLFRQANPVFQCWGPEHTAIYNEPCIAILGDKHPLMMGSSYPEMHPDIWDHAKSYFEHVKRTGTGMNVPNYCLFIKIGDAVEETWWDAHIQPLTDGSGNPEGIWVSWKENTRDMFANRQTNLINDIGQVQHLSVRESIWDHMLTCLKKYTRDIPMAVMYAAEPLSEGEYLLNLKGTIGVDSNSLVAPSTMDLKRHESGFAPFLRQAKESTTEWFTIPASSVSESILASIDWKGYGEPSSTLVIIPVLILNKILKGFVILGLNPRRPFDESHKQFITDLRRQLVGAVTSTTTLLDAQQREAALSLQLAETETRIRRMAEFAPVGMYELSAMGQLVWANAGFFEVLGVKRPTELKDFSWPDAIHEEDIGAASAGLAAGIMNGTNVSGPLRLKRTWRPPPVPDSIILPEQEVPSWVLYQAFPNLENGQVVSLMGFLTDITPFKWAETLNALIAEAAQRARERQEEFIDLTSHEIRNPLSAITQCADSISSAMQNYFKDPSKLDDLFEVMKTISEASESILLCAMHQTRIIDDVLTLSKLESSILPVCPSAFLPGTLIKETMQMFSSEFSANSIEADAALDQSLLKQSQYVQCDPVRLMQVLVNLVTNAIKFTRTQTERVITIRYGGLSEPPDSRQFGPTFEWSTSHKRREDLTGQVEYGDGQILYLYFAVTDTGQGLPSKSAIRIFDKFVQASRRTHIKYGGSGLGLFISRELTELQGGQIGVGSEEGIGSTFVFFVKTRVCPKPAPMVEAVTARRNSTARASPRGLVTSFSQTTIYVLLVEDNLVNQKVLAKQLRKAGCQVWVANHGGEAVDFVLRCHDQPPEFDHSLTTPLDTYIDCILMDWEMPVLDGLSATKRIRQLEEGDAFNGRRYPVIGTTANARPEQVQTAMDAGMDLVVVKPFRVHDLVRKIESLLMELSRTRMEH